MEVDLPCLLRLFTMVFLFSFMVISVFYPITYSTGFYRACLIIEKILFE
jgi:hypothetical protein